MKKILLYGDSNVYGFNPDNGLKYADDIYFSAIFKKELEKNNYTVVIDGCNNRTCFSNTKEAKLCATKDIKRHFNNNYNDIIFLIGINDLQFRYNVSFKDYIEHFIELIDAVKKNYPNINLTLLCPCKIQKTVINHPFFSKLFDKTSIEKSLNLSLVFKTIKDKNNCRLIDLNDIVQASQKDGLHFEKEAHKLIAKKTYRIVFKINIYPKRLY